MRPSSFVLVPLLAAVAASAPAPNPGTSIQAAQDSAAATMKTLEAAGCNYLSNSPENISSLKTPLTFDPECISALAGETAACGAAAAELGASTSIGY
jgi:hypothetical protein